MLRLFVFGARPERTLIRAGLIIVVAIVTFGWLLLPIRGFGVSMTPTYREGSFNLVNRLSYIGRAPARGDVVAIRMAGRRVMFVKRIIGLPGERVRMNSGLVFIDSRQLDEPYVRPPASWSFPDTQLDTDEYFVVGDNRGMPLASHSLGKVRRDRIVGKLLF